MEKEKGERGERGEEGGEEGKLLRTGGIESHIRGHGRPKKVMMAVNDCGQGSHVIDYRAKKTLKTSELQ